MTAEIAPSSTLIPSGDSWSSPASAPMRNPRPSHTLPTLRLLLRPRPGLGLDARIPFTHHFRCFMAAEAYFQGVSMVRFGLESVKFPIRLELAPTMTLSVRPSILRVSYYKFIVPGINITIYDAMRNTQGTPSLRTPFSGDLQGSWTSLRQLISPVLELQHRNTLLGTLIDPDRRESARGAVRKTISRAAALKERTMERRKAALKSFRQDSMPPVDPRTTPDPAEHLKARLRQRENQIPLPQSSAANKNWPGVSRDEELLLEHIRAKILQQSKSPDPLKRSANTNASRAGNSISRREPLKVIGRMQKDKHGNLVLVPDLVESTNNVGNSGEPEGSANVLSSSSKAVGEEGQSNSPSSIERPIQFEEESTPLQAISSFLRSLLPSERQRTSQRRGGLMKSLQIPR